MKCSSFIVILLFFVLMSSSFIISQPPQPSVTVFVFYKFALQWPPGICASTIQCNGGFPKDLTIHGLWPQDGQDIEVPSHASNPSCSALKVATPAAVQTILKNDANLVKQLIQAWPDLKDITSDAGNKKFWLYEWEKHGMCSDYGDNPVEYFTAAIDLRKNIVSVLKLKPGTHKVHQIAATVSAQVKGIPEINCVKQGKSNKVLLGEVRLCYEKGNPSPQGIRNCPHPYSGYCKSDQDDITIL